jgi:hypothetical protein
MLKNTQLIHNTSVDRLVKLWSQRYVPDLSPLRLGSNQLELYQDLVKAASSEGRVLTAAAMDECLIELKCQMAKLQTDELYAYIPNIVDLAETKRLSHFACLVYKKLMEIYQQPSHSVMSQTVLRMAGTIDSVGGSLASWGMPAIEELAAALEPLLLEFQMQHIASKDWRTLGFITTLLNFANKLLLSKLTLSEQILLKPYFKFIEEQVALPWQRVCAAATRHQLESPALTLVEQMFPLSGEIAETVYRRLAQLLPNHRSRRGGLDDLGITHSCVRDLEMFQAYLWLCILEESMAPVKEELVDLCVMVMTGVDVKWEMTELWNKVLADEILAHVTPAQRTLLWPYTQGLQQAFYKERDRFKGTVKNHPVSSNVINISVFQTPRSFYFPAGNS